jgi:hypothetical protein
MKFPLILLFASFVAVALPSRAEIQLRGFTITNGEPLFSLYSTADQTSKWVSFRNGDSRQTLRLQNAAIKDSTAEAIARLQALSGIELAYELARQGDVEIAAKLKNYQNVVTRLADIRIAISLQRAEGKPEVPMIMVRGLENQRDELAVQVEHLAAKKAYSLKAAAKP